MLRLKSMLFLHNKVSKRTRRAVFYILFENLRDRGKDRYWAVTFGQCNITFSCEGLMRVSFNLCGKISLDEVKEALIP